VYGAVNCCLVPISARKLLEILLASCTQLSVMTSSGTPYRAIIRSLKALFMDSDVAPRSDTNSVHFENRSINAISKSYCCNSRAHLAILPKGLSKLLSYFSAMWSVVTFQIRLELLIAQAIAKQSVCNDSGLHLFERRLMFLCPHPLIALE